MKKRFNATAGVVLATLALAGSHSAPARAQLFSSDPLQKIENAVTGPADESQILAGRLQVREMAQDALAQLYEAAPGAKRAITRSAGYAVFSTFGIKLFFAGGTSGKGVVTNARTGRQTFMRMLQVQGGLGFGLAKSRLIFVFANENALSAFIQQGWEFGAQANLSAMAGGSGSMFTGAAAVSPGVYVYQLTDTGLAATLTVAGTRFFKDDTLN